MGSAQGAKIVPFVRQHLLPQKLGQWIGLHAKLVSQALITISQVHPLAQNAFQALLPPASV
jgi:hypothetical protein